MRNDVSFKVEIVDQDRVKITAIDAITSELKAVFSVSSEGALYLSERLESVGRRALKISDKIEAARKAAGL
jgi:hypothetical protein